jgi:hypothetical protein
MVGAVRGCDRTETTSCLHAGCSWHSRPVDRPQLLGANSCTVPRWRDSKARLCHRDAPCRWAVNTNLIHMRSPRCREAQAELVERIQVAVALPVRTSIKDVYDDTCTELLVTSQLDSGAPRSAVCFACCDRR